MSHSVLNKLSKDKTCSFKTDRVVRVKVARKSPSSCNLPPKAVSGNIPLVKKVPQLLKFEGVWMGGESS